MARKHKFMKPKADMAEADAEKLASVPGPKTKDARARLASMGKNVPGPARSKSIGERMKHRYGG